MKSMLGELKWRTIGFAGKWLIDLLFWTTPIESEGFDEARSKVRPDRAIAAFWHSRILLISYLFKGWNAAVLTSASKDGEFVARIVQKQGHVPVRGSTTRGGLRAIAALIRYLNGGKPGVIIPDGPQGPRFQVQPGIITLAKKTGLPIVPITYSAKRIKVFNSWDRFILPYPFTTCRVVYGEPVWVPEHTDSAGEEEYRRVLEHEMRRITRQADARFGHVIE